MYTKETVKLAAQLEWPKALIVAVNLKQTALPARLFEFAAYECMLVVYSGGRCTSGADVYRVYVGTSWRDVAAQARLSLPEQPISRGHAGKPPFYAVK